MLYTFLMNYLSRNQLLPKKGGQSAAILVKTWTRAIDMSMSLHNNNIPAPNLQAIVSLKLLLILFAREGIP